MSDNSSIECNPQDSQPPPKSTRHKTRPLFQIITEEVQKLQKIKSLNNSSSKEESDSYSFPDYAEDNFDFL